MRSGGGVKDLVANAVEQLGHSPENVTHPSGPRITILCYATYSASKLLVGQGGENIILLFKDMVNKQWEGELGAPLVTEPPHSAQVCGPVFFVGVLGFILLRDRQFVCDRDSRINQLKQGWPLGRLSLLIEPPGIEGLLNWKFFLKRLSPQPDPGLQLMNPIHVKVLNNPLALCIGGGVGFGDIAKDWQLFFDGPIKVGASFPAVRD